uniref:LisH domain-containing protein n=1 Tax=Ascaris lumbricoides TaxID=6252 RepID=A0A9J2PRW3_ASCLU
MTDVIGLVDSLVKDYLSFRGFNATLASFEAETRHERDCKFSVSRVVGELFSAIENHDIDRLHSLWSYFNVKVFSCLSDEQSAMASKLENDVYRLYVITCVQQKQRSKCVEFFEHMCEHLRNNPEWSDWFALPYVIDPRNSQPFKVYFTRYWQHCLVVSLNNFLAIAFDRLEVPLLVRCVNEVLKGSGELSDAELNRRSQPFDPYYPVFVLRYARMAEWSGCITRASGFSFHMRHIFHVRNLTVCCASYVSALFLNNKLLGMGRFLCVRWITLSRTMTSSFRDALNSSRTLTSLPTTSKDKGSDLETSKSELLQPIDIEDLPRAQKRFAKQFEKVNEERVKEIFEKNYKNQIGMAVLVATAVAIYFYTIHAVKQETFLEEIDEEVAKELAEAEAAKQKN